MFLCQLCTDKKVHDLTEFSNITFQKNYILNSTNDLIKYYYRTEMNITAYFI